MLILQCEIKPKSIKNSETVGLTDKTEILMMTPPSIDTSTRDERREFVLHQWRCLHNCDICGKCSILRGREAELVYADYIEGRRPYMEITFEIRNNNY